MALPKIDVPIFKATLPTTQQEISLRPFTVKEEKILLIADETKDATDIVDAIKQVVRNCIIDDTDPSSISMIDLQYLFLQLRSKSIGNITEILISDPEDGKKYKVEVDLNKLEVIRPEDVSNVVMLTDQVGMTLRHPTMDLAKEAQLTTEGLVKNCLLNIFDADQVYEVADQSQEELSEFIQSLTTNHVTKIKAFFDSAPIIKYDVKYTTEDGREKTLEVTNINDFFQ